METWPLGLISLFVLIAFKFIFSGKKSQRLPPGPLALPLIGNPIWFTKPITDIEAVLRDLHAKYGPIITLHFGSSRTVFVANHSLAHQALIQHGAVLADRAPVPSTVKVITSNQQNLSTSFYGPLWRLLRRNLSSEILQPSRVKSCGPVRKWSLDELFRRLAADSNSGKDPVKLIDHFRHAMYMLTCVMTFGNKLEDKIVREITAAERQMLMEIEKFNSLNMWGNLGKILFRKRWQEFLAIRKRQEDVLLPLIKARRKMAGKDNDWYESPYIDTLLGLEHPEEKRPFTEDELVTLCSEFIDAVTDTTIASVQWIMANLVKYPQIQEKIFLEIKGVLVGNREREVNEDDLQQMTYIKAVVLEGLRRHPPGHFLLAHTSAEDVTIDGYLVPKNTPVNFMVAEIGWDSKVWEDPMAFKPERFLGNEEFDITGSRGIQMLPFGAGRRICPGMNLGLLHLEYFVANLVWKFKWTAAGEIDITETRESTVVMKNPLKAYVSPRF